MTDKAKFYTYSNDIVKEELKRSKDQLNKNKLAGATAYRSTPNTSMMKKFSSTTPDTKAHHQRSPTFKPRGATSALTRKSRKSSPTANTTAYMDAASKTSHDMSSVFDFNNAPRISATAKPKMRIKSAAANSIKKRWGYDLGGILGDQGIDVNTVMS